MIQKLGGVKDGGKGPQYRHVGLKVVNQFTSIAVAEAYILAAEICQGAFAEEIDIWQHL